MRRRYPGHQSYSLGNLCETYDIDLTTIALSATQAQLRTFSILSISNVMGGPKRAALPRKHDQ